MNFNKILKKLNVAFRLNPPAIAQHIGRGGIQVSSSWVRAALGAKDKPGAKKINIDHLRALLTSLALDGEDHQHILSIPSDECEQYLDQLIEQKRNERNSGGELSVEPTPATGE